MTRNVRFMGTLMVGLWLLVPLALAQGEPSGEYGMLELGSSVERHIAGVPRGGAEFLTFHTYLVEVPAGVDAVAVAVEGFGHDMDVAVKVGAPIVDYEDVDVLDVEDTLDPQVTVEAPGGTRVYVDVLNLLPAEARYRLTVTAAEGGRVLAGGDVGGADAVGEADRGEQGAGNPLAGVGSGGANPLAPRIDPFAGTFEGDGLRAVFEATDGGYEGTFTLGGARYDLAATADEERLTGRFRSGGEAFTFTAWFEGEALVIESGGARYEVRAVGQAENPLAGEAGGDGPAGAGAPPEGPGPVLSEGAHGTLYEDDARAFLEALEFSLQQVGYAGTFSAEEREQILQATAQAYPTLTPDEQAVLAQARQVWTRVQSNWQQASVAEREQFVMGVFVLAFGEQAMQRAAASAGGAGGGGAGASGACSDIDACISQYADPGTLSDTMNAQSCWAAAGCSGYDPVTNDFSYDSYGDGY